MYFCMVPRTGHPNVVYNQFIWIFVPTPKNHNSGGGRGLPRIHEMWGALQVVRCDELDAASLSSPSLPLSGDDNPNVFDPSRRVDSKNSIKIVQKNKKDADSSCFVQGTRQCTISNQGTAPF